ncbi:hypothetical protein ACIBF1_42925 [Spirillospora sp. NPDC050679]
MDSYRGSGGGHGAAGDGYRTGSGEHGQAEQRSGGYGQVPAGGYGAGAHTGGVPVPDAQATGDHRLTGTRHSAQQPAGGSAGYPAGYPAGGSAGHPAEGSSGYNAGGSANYPAGDSAAYPAGGPAAYPAGGSAGYLTGGSATYPAGGSAAHPAGGPAGYPAEGSAGYPVRDSAAYATRDSAERPAQGTGEHPVRGSGEYGLGGGRYSDAPSASSQTGGHRTATGEHRRPAPPGPRRSASGTGHRSGSGSHRRVERERRTGRRLGLILAGVATGAGVCVLAAVAILSNVGVGGERDAGQIVGSGAAESSAPAKSERSVVPDACELVGADLAGKLAPKADRTQADNYQSNERQNQCVWGAYIGDRKRQLTLELRAIAGAAEQSPTDAARRTFGSERRDDESGKALLAGQELTDKAKPADLGEESYVVYSVDKSQGSGEAIANVRVSNVLVTVHYSGSNHGDPLSADDAMDGSVEAARAAVKQLAAEQ